MIYDVDEALAKVLDPNVNRCERAVAFFEFYVALLYCSGLAASVDGRSSFRIEVGGRHLHRARMCAWMSCLQHLCPAGPSDRAAAAAGAEPEAPTGNSINEYLQGALQFGRGGGWGNVLRDWEVDAVEDELASRWKQFSRVAPLLDFSIRIDPEDLGPRKTGGVTMALEILTENRFLGVRVSRTALAQLWSQYKPVSVFSYLFATQKYARPSPLVSEHFGEHLLHIIDSREDLGCFVSTYMAARVRLQERHYIGLPELRLATTGGLPAPDLSVDPLCPEIRGAVLRYGKRISAKNAFRIKSLN